MQSLNKLSLFNFIKFKLEETLDNFGKAKKNLQFALNINFANDFPLSIYDENEKYSQFKLKLLKQGTREKINENKFDYLLGNSKLM